MKFIHSGKFENRDVAVKRLDIDDYDIAQREQSLLIESDGHANIIHYFCMEKDKEHFYIALEICDATLDEFVSGEIAKNLIEPETALEHITKGLNYLHSINIGKLY